MVSFKNHQKSKKITLKDTQGVEQEYEFIALGAKHLPALFKVINSFSSIKEDSDPELIMSCLDEDTVSSLQELIREMVKKSYKSIEEEDCESFVAAHFTDLMGVLFEINMPKQA